MGSGVIEYEVRENFSRNLHAHDPAFEESVAHCRSDLHTGLVECRPLL